MKPHIGFVLEQMLGHVAYGMSLRRSLAQRTDGAALRDRLERLARDPPLAARMGLRSREIAEERFDMDKNANRIADLLVDMARRPSSVAGA